MRRYLLSLFAFGLLYGCGASDTFSPTVGGVPQGDFSLTIASESPSNQAVSLGNSVTYNLVATSTSGFSSPVSLTTSGAPAGAGVTLSPNPVTPSSNGTPFTLTIDTGGSLTGTIRSIQRTRGGSGGIPTGDYTITITGTGGGKTHTVSVDLTVNPAGGG